MEFICKIIKVEEKSFVMMCILDKDKKIAQPRRFMNGLTFKNLNIVEGNYVKIEVIESENTIRYNYSHCELSEEEKDLFVNPILYHP